MIAIDLSKKQALDADPQAVQEINFTGNLEEKEQCFSFLKKRKEQFWIFHKKLQKYSNSIFCVNIKCLNITI